LESEEGRERIERLWSLRERLAGGLDEAGVETGGSITPIIPVMCENTADALRLAEGLFELGYYAPAIRPPTVTEPMIRLSLSAEHEELDIDGLIQAIADVSKRT
jgi:7-keto-8-aminopelargonate synthetase-like enzyme